MERLGQHAEFIPVLRLKLNVQVARREFIRSGKEIFKRLGHAAGHHHGTSQTADTDDQDNAEDDIEYFCEIILQVVDIDSGTDDPSPRFEKLDIGNFRHRFRFALLGPHILDQAFSFLLAYLGKFYEESFPIGILLVRYIFTFQLGFVRMHNHLGYKIVDPEILFLCIAEVLHIHGRPFLGVLQWQFPLLYEVIILHEGTVSHIDHMLCRFDFFIIQLPSEMIRQPSQGQHKTHNDNDRLQNDSCREFSVCEHFLALLPDCCDLS